MFGYIICGVLLGPSGLNSIKVRTQFKPLQYLFNSTKKTSMKTFIKSFELELMKITISYKSY